MQETVAAEPTQLHHPTCVDERARGMVCPRSRSKRRYNAGEIDHVRVGRRMYLSRAALTKCHVPERLVLTWFMTVLS